MSLIGLLGAGVSALGGVASTLFGKKAQSDTNKANMELAKYQYEKNLEMWNLQNEYNTPLNQRKRMEQAGFNPNLVYGHGTVANTASNAPTYQAPTLQAYTNLPNIGEAIVNTLNNTRIAEAQAKKAEAEAIKAREDARGQGLSNDIFAEFGRADAKYNNELLEYKRNFEKERNKYVRQRAYYEKQNDKTMWHYYANKIDEIQRNIDYIDSKINLNNSQRDYVDAQTDTEREKPSLIRAEVATEGARKNLIVEQRNTERHRQYNLDASSRNYIASAINTEIRNQFQSSLTNAEIDKISASVTKIFNETMTESARYSLTKEQMDKVFMEKLLLSKEYKWFDVEKIVGLSKAVIDMLKPPKIINYNY